MKCPKCGKEVKKGKFCQGCGTDVNAFKNNKKQVRKEKVLKVKSRIALVLFLIFILLLTMIITQNLYFIKNNFKYSEKSETAEVRKPESVVDKVDIEKEIELANDEIPEFELTEDNKDEDWDKDGLSNEEEVALGTSPLFEDSDNDRLTDYDEVKNHNSDPLKYSTSGDGISDYVKVKKDLEIDKKYSEKDIELEDIKVNSSVTLVPKNAESEVLGKFEAFSKDKNVEALVNSFTVYDFEGKIEYNLDKVDVILLVCYNNKYTEYDDYSLKADKMVINIDKEDDAKVFTITTKENYNKYLKGDNSKNGGDK